MSLPNSIFSASRKDAIAQANGKKANVGGLYEFGGITDLDFSNLFSIIAGEEFNFDLHEILPLEAETDCELFELPKRFIEVSAEKSESDVNSIASEWAATEELECEPENLVPIVSSFISLCKSAGSNNVYFTVGA